MTYYLLPWLLSACLSNWFFFSNFFLHKTVFHHPVFLKSAVCYFTDWGTRTAVTQIHNSSIGGMNRGEGYSFFLTLACTATTAFVRFSFGWSGFLLRSEDRLRWDWDSQMWTGLSFHVLVMCWTVALFAKIFTTSWYDDGHIISEVLIPLV